jgi:hypothetical protein
MQDLAYLCKSWAFDAKSAGISCDAAIGHLKELSQTVQDVRERDKARAAAHEKNSSSGRSTVRLIPFLDITIDIFSF